MFLSLIHYSNPIQVTIQLLQQLKVKVTNSTVSNVLEIHPDYPSLLSIYDVLQEFKINAYPLTVKKENLAKLPVPFITHVTTKGGSFVTVFSMDGEYLKYFSGNNKNETITSTLEEFADIWTNRILLATATPNSGEVNFHLQRRKELLQNNRVPLLFFGLMICGILVDLNVFANGSFKIALSYSIFLLLSFAGIIVSSFLLWYEVDNTNAVLKKICSTGTKTNCNAILNSKQAKLFNWISWSEIGFYYFSGSYILLIIIGTNAIPIIVILNILALPYIFYSIYYQWRIAKQWCTLCLGVQMLLFLGGTSIFILRLLSVLSFSSIVDINYPLIFFAFFMPIIIWSNFRPIILKNKELQPRSKELSRLKSDKKIFENILGKQKQITIVPSGLGIYLGNPVAKNTIIKVCNPFCGPCSKSHPIVEDLLYHNSNIKVQIIFTTISVANDKKGNPVKLFLALQERYGIERIMEALNDWYALPTKDYMVFALKYPIDEYLLKRQDVAILSMLNWCEEMDIKFTPTFFINGYQLPEIYSIEDVKYLLR